MPADRRQLRALALLVLVMLLWAGNSIVGRAVRDDVAPFTLAFVRWAGASLVLLPFAIGPLRRDWPAIRRGWKPILALGLLGIAAFNALLYSGLHYTTATNALLLQAAIPPAVMLADRLFFGARAGRGQQLGVLASVLGVVVIVFEGDPGAALRLHFGRGDGLVLAAVLAWALYTVFLKLRPAISPVSFIAATFAIGMLAMAPLAAMEWQAGHTVVLTPNVAGAFLYVCLLPSLLSYFIYNHAAGVLGASRTGQAITLMPLFGALLSAGLLGEALHPFHFAGMALILAGIVVAALAGRPREALQDQP
ncbi:MAG: permease [Sphingomonadales bacterium 32-68-7]|nr:MAG: permease [Sphingomonadales bacterium 12-68-11]OYX10232.1 MAG: permease [Sphingomonadales bacterium 32-68-7]